ncbi:hypothetical protein CYFUS_008758 [Cystobacter fuscus]|uniref:Uncharacterized protein n=1 Tax=Cystobacter fuscus TaxID=43 RepID=A0A250JI54_9BACT|nr:hypothetical protein CYFUS_008758 [Cystobacter fuscus]
MKRGFKPLQVSDWTEVPHYDKARHELIWALEALADNGASVNHSTLLLAVGAFALLERLFGKKEAEVSPSVPPTE